jgi:ATP-dependent DNA helicase RecG
VTIIDEMPANRLPVETFAVTENMRQRAFGFIKKELDKKHQAYIVCPAIGNLSEDSTAEEPEELKAVVAYSENLARGFFRNYIVGLLHGKLSSAEKENVMAKFKSGEIDILVATTVVEVGVDVPNATVMLIENAERFGLSQLHQLRGRIGRGDAQSYCILIAALTNATDNENIKQRLKVISSTTDGFKIAEEDFKLRGPGDFLGNKQHGLPKFKIADIASDMELITLTAECSKNILQEDKTLAKEKYHSLKIEIMRMIELMKNG